jgi:CheY-like chemotaxis protein
MSRILIIEGNPVNMELTTFLLNGIGYEVLQATDAESGIEQVRSEMPALVLMDVQLPGMDGLAATRQLKTDPATAHIPVIAITSHAMKGDEEAMLAAGYDSCLSTPFHLRDLRDQVNTLLDRPRLTLVREIKHDCQDTDH